MELEIKGSGTRGVATVNGDAATWQLIGDSIELTHQTNYIIMKVYRLPPYLSAADPELVITCIVGGKNSLYKPFSPADRLQLV